MSGAGALSGSAVDPRIARAARRARSAGFPVLAGLVGALRTIPGGVSTIGSDLGDADERPARAVALSPFLLAATPVTVRGWREFAGACRSGRMPSEPDPRGLGGARPFNPGWSCGDHPIVNVDWSACREFAQWASDVAGLPLDLPSEAQWEHAARGGLAGREYPWGDDWNPDRAWISHAVLGDRGGTGSLLRSERIWRDHPYGVIDLVGNVWEWCVDAYHPEWAARPDARRADPVNRDIAVDISRTYVDGRTESGPCKGVRGGSWIYFQSHLFRCATRLGVHPNVEMFSVGFRLSAALPGLRGA
ncbi:MAG: formylglycine-generating enzyme family protein [Armatimonadota bacterium]